MANAHPEYCALSAACLCFEVVNAVQHEVGVAAQQLIPQSIVKHVDACLHLNLRVDAEHGY